MGFSFRKRIKLFKGVHLNVGKTGASVSVGGRGISMTRGRGRTSVSVGMPGTGLSYRSTTKDRPQPLVASVDLHAALNGNEGLHQTAAYERGRELARVGLLRSLLGWLLRGLALLFGLSGAIAALAAAAPDFKVVALMLLVTGSAAAGCWWAGTRLLKR